MNFDEPAGVIGHLECWAKKEGRRVKIVDVDNLIVDTGTNHLAQRLAGTSNEYITHAEIGSSTVAPTAADTALGSAIIRKTVTNTFPGIGMVRFAWTTLTTEANSPGTISEAGLFMASSGGTMFNRVTFSPIVKDEDVELEWTWTITFQSA